MTLNTALETALNRIEDMLSDDDGQAFKEARKFLSVGRAALGVAPGDLGGSSYEAAMLRELLANIHRDGGHYVARHGLEKALSDAHAVISELRCAALPTPAQHV